MKQQTNTGTPPNNVVALPLQPKKKKMRAEDKWSPKVAIRHRRGHAERDAANRQRAWCRLVRLVGRRDNAFIAGAHTSLVISGITVTLNSPSKFIEDVQTADATGRLGSREGRVLGTNSVLEMARSTRFERVTSTFGGWRAIHLSYGRVPICICAQHTALMISFV
jgi:hypothetical protein